MIPVRMQINTGKHKGETRWTSAGSNPRRGCGGVFAADGGGRGIRSRQMCHSPWTS